jgi:uncharacterized protein YndB with AHSA1/START domain
MIEPGESTTEPIRMEFEVDCPVDHAFTIWTARTSAWWPLSHTVSTAPGLTVSFEAQEGGRIFERTPSGDEFDWGRIVVWDPPRRLVYSWHLRVDRVDATEVDISFVPVPGGRTRVEIEHRGWERLGSVAAPRRAGNLAGWGGLLPHFQAATRDAAIRASVGAGRERPAAP